MALEITRQLTFRVSLLEPISYGRARVVKTWVTDSAGAVEALDEQLENLAVQVVAEDWDDEEYIPGLFGPRPATQAPVLQ